jgi:co-chaperonin GroES (HSP10)
MSNLKARAGNIVLKQLNSEEMTIGNIVIPDVGNEKALVAEIVSVSDVYNFHRGEFIPTDLKVGMKVVLPPMGATKQKIDNVEYLITSQENCISIIEE